MKSFNRAKCSNTGLFLTIGILMMAAGCSSPVKPGGTATVTAASLIAPANGAQIANTAQPVTLTVNNATVTGSSTAVTYTFEVATDSAFASKVVTKDVPQGVGQTSLKLDPLAAGKDYYWHVRTTADTVGTFSTPSKFTVSPTLVLSAPVPLSPASGSSRIIWPTLTVANGVRSAPVGAAIYRFDISASSAFSTVLTTGTVPEGATQTSFTPDSSLAAPAQTTQYFWRATALDQTNLALSEATTAQAFTFDPPTSAAASWPPSKGSGCGPGSSRQARPGGPESATTGM